MKRFKNKKTIIILVIVLLIICGLVLSMFLLKKEDKKKEKKEPKIDVVLVDNLKVEINNEVKISDFITKINTGEMISEDKVIDTTKLGKQKIVIEIMYKEKKYNYDFEIEVVDTTPPVIEAKDEISIYVGNTVDLIKDVKVTDNSKQTDNKVTVDGSYDFNKAGDYNLNYVAVDKSGNEAKKPLVLRVKTDPNNRVITTSKGYTLKIVNGVAYVDGILIANKSYALPSTYGNGLTNDTLNNYNSMKAAAATDGINIYIISGYRSYYDQQYIYNNYVNRDGQAAADRYSARPGHSEHQTGLAFDLNSVEFAFEYTNEAKWINNNCYKYGFILRYPKGKESITGYMYEPWHLRYVGVDLATKLYNNGNWITLEEYFGIDSKY